MLEKVAEEFVDNITTYACRLAKHRGSTTVEEKDVLLHLGGSFNKKPSYELQRHRPYLGLLRLKTNSCSLPAMSPSSSVRPSSPLPAPSHPSLSLSLSLLQSNPLCACFSRLMSWRTKICLLLSPKSDVTSESERKSVTSCLAFDTWMPKYVSAGWSILI